MGSKIDEGTDEAGEEPGDDGSDDEDEWFIAWSRWPAQGSSDQNLSRDLFAVQVEIISSDKSIGVPQSLFLLLSHSGHFFYSYHGQDKVEASCVFRQRRR